MRKRGFIASFVFLLLVGLGSPSKAVHQSTNDLDLPGLQTVENTEFFLEHRFYGSIDDKPLENFFGIDSGANTTVGMGFKLKDNLDLTILRSPLDKEYYLAGKCRLFGEMSLLAGASAKTTPASVANRSSFVLQLIYSKTIKEDLLYFGFVPTIVSAKLDDPTFALGTLLSYSFIPELEAIVEYIPVLSGYKLTNPTATFGAKIKTWGHFFTLLLSNSVQTLPAGYIIGSPDNKFHFGFNLIRRF